MAYATEAEFEGLTGRTISATTKPTSTQLGVMLTEVSNRLDGLCHESAGGLGTLEWTTQAVIAGVSFIIDTSKKGEIVDQQKLNEVLKGFIPDADEGKKIFSYQDYPNSTGDW